MSKGLLLLVTILMVSSGLFSCASTKEKSKELSQESKELSKVEVEAATEKSSVLFDAQIASVRLTKTETIGLDRFNKERLQLESIVGKKLSTQEQVQLLDYLVDEILLVQAAVEMKLFIPKPDLDNEITNRMKRLNISTAEDFKKAVLQSFPSMEDYVASLEKQLLRDKYLMQSSPAAYQNTEIKPEDILSAYQANIKEFAVPAQVEFQHLFVPFRTLTEEQQVLAGKRMNEISLDIQKNGKSAYQDYATGKGLNKEYLFSAGVVAQDPQLVQYYGQAFINKVLTLKTGEYSDPISSLQGLHIVVVTAKRDAQVLELDSQVTIDGKQTSPRELIKASLNDQLRTKAIAEARAKVLQNLRSRSDIFVDNSSNWTSQ